jgi:lysozyme family protein
MAKITEKDFTCEFIIRDKTDVEGGYVDDPDDNGKCTNHGITQALAEQYKTTLKTKFGWDGNMRNLTTEMAFFIYKTHFWDKMKLDDVMKRSVFLADRLFDLGINAGKTVAVKNLQRYLNVMNNRQTYWKDIDADGAMGPKSLAALDAYIAKRGATGKDYLIDAMLDMQSTYYIELAERREKDEKFIYGWQARKRRERKRYEAICLNGFSVE